MTIYFGADHRGFECKSKLLAFAREKGWEGVDCGNTQLDPADDYPHFAFLVGEKVAENPGSLGVLCCGSGAGVCVAANKVPGVRASILLTPEQARVIRRDDDITVGCIPCDFSTIETVKQMIELFVTTPFAADVDRYARRKEMIASYEARQRTT